MAVFEADGLKTGPDGHLGVTLQDDTRIPLGPGSEVHLDRFQDEPADNRLGFSQNRTGRHRGTSRDESPSWLGEAVRLQTPNAIVGIRGTHLVIRVDDP